MYTPALPPLLLFASICPFMLVCDGVFGAECGTGESGLKFKNVPRRESALGGLLGTPIPKPIHLCMLGYIIQLQSWGIALGQY